jgi:hypothetical protein
MKNHKMTASIALDEQGKIMGGSDVRPKSKSFIDSIKNVLKPTPTIPIIPTIISY